jgi:hypothetical protein
VANVRSIPQIFRSWWLVIGRQIENSDLETYPILNEVRDRIFHYGSKFLVF